MIYLASPYAHPDPVVQQYRYQRACRATSLLMAAGIPVFSPLCNSVPAVELGGLDLDHAGFMVIDLAILRRCDEVLIVGLDGWDKSKGVMREISEALSQSIPMTMIRDTDIERLPAVPKRARYFRTSSIFTEVYGAE